jgi:hypothetical protein
MFGISFGSQNVEFIPGALEICVFGEDDLEDAVLKFGPNTNDQPVLYVRASIDPIRSVLLGSTCALSCPQGFRIGPRYEIDLERGCWVYEEQAAITGVFNKYVKFFGESQLEDVLKFIKEQEDVRH